MQLIPQSIPLRECDPDTDISILQPFDHSDFSEIDMVLNTVQGDSIVRL